MQINRKSLEFCFVIYVFSFALLKPIIALFPRYSSVILFVCATLIILRRLIITTSMTKRNFIIWLFGSFFFIAALLIGNYLNNYEQTKQYVINFIIYGIIPLFLLNGVEDFSQVLQLVSRFSFYATAVLIWDPFIDYAMTGGYMTYGYSLLWYSFAGLVLSFFYYEKKYALPLIFIDLIVLLIYANKGATLCALILLFISILSKGKFNLFKGALLSFAFVLFVFWKSITLFFVSYLTKLGYNSYSLSTLEALAKNTREITSIRTNLWRMAFDFFLDNPFGRGVGAFEVSSNGYYTHNVGLDILVMFGIFGIVIYIIMTIWAIAKIIKLKDKEKKIFLMGAGICWFLPMQISLTMWNVVLFWIFWGVLLYDNSEREEDGF